MQTKPEKREHQRQKREGRRIEHCPKLHQDQPQLDSEIKMMTNWSQWFCSSYQLCAFIGIQGFIEK